MLNALWEMAANHKVRQAYENGDFDNLKGHGKPLDRLGEDVATRLLKNSGG